MKIEVEVHAGKFGGEWGASWRTTMADGDSVWRDIRPSAKRETLEKRIAEMLEEQALKAGRTLVAQVEWFA